MHTVSNMSFKNLEEVGEDEEEDMSTQRVVCFESHVMNVRKI
jgi:hypothetical protein